MASIGISATRRTIRDAFLLDKKHQKPTVKMLRVNELRTMNRITTSVRRAANLRRLLCVAEQRDGLEPGRL
jgi:hypothetical protein